MGDVRVLATPSVAWTGMTVMVVKWIGSPKGNNLDHADIAPVMITVMSAYGPGRTG